MESVKYKNLEILKFNHIDTLHGITTRKGGVSKGGYESLNLVFTVMMTQKTQIKITKFFLMH